MSFKVKFERIKDLLFQNTNLKQTVLKNAFWLSVGNIGARIIKAILIIFAARWLGANGYGVFSYTIGLAGFFTIFSDIGISGIMTREASKAPELLPKYLSTALFIKIILVGLSAAAIIFIAPSFTKISEALPLLPLAAFLLAFDGLRDFTFGIVRSKEKMELEAGINVFTNIAITILGLIALLIKSDAKILMTAYTIGSGLGLLFSLWLLRENFRKIWQYFDKNLIKQIFLNAWPFALTGLLGAVLINTDIIMLGWLKDAKEVGYYSAAQRPVQLLYLIPAIIATSLFPSFAKWANKDNEKFKQVFEKAMKSVFLVAFPIFVGGFILASQIINLLFGAGFQSSTPIFMILLPTIFLVFPGNLFGNAIFAYNRQKTFLISLSLGGIGNIIFNLILIPPFGGIGSAVATIFAQILANGFNWYTMKKINNFKAIGYLLKIIGGAVIMGLTVWTLKILGVPVIVNILLGIIIYFLALILFREPLIDTKIISKILK